jgi:hypothetical protein
MDEHSPEHPVQKSPTEARQGSTPGVVRWVLLVSTVGAVVALFLVYWATHGL